MKIKRSKEWWSTKAKLEEGSDCTVHPPVKECDGCGLEFWGSATNYLEGGLCPVCRGKAK